MKRTKVLDKRTNVNDTFVCTSDQAQSFCLNNLFYEDIFKVEERKSVGDRLLDVNSFAVDRLSKLILRIDRVWSKLK